VFGRDRIKLTRGREAEDDAWREYYKVMARQGPAQPAAKFRDPTVTNVCNLFLDHSEKAHKRRTYEFSRDFLEDFCGYAGKLEVRDLDASHVTQWLARHTNWDGCRRGRSPPSSAPSSGRTTRARSPETRCARS
jgi:hypothetical protein